MSFTDDIIAKYASVFTGRLWWDEMPASVAVTLGANGEVLPFCIAERMSGTPREYVDNDKPEFKNARVQFTVWGTRRRDVDLALQALEDAIRASSGTEWVATIETEPMHDANEILKLRGSRQDFKFWFKNP